MAADDETPDDSGAQLHASLGDLHEALGATDSLEPAQAEELRRALHEIREKLEAADELDAPLLERLNALVLRFEAEHPALAEATGRVIRTLSRLGI